MLRRSIKYIKVIGFMVVLCVFTYNLYSQNKQIKIQYYYAKDSIRFEKDVSDIDFNYQKDLYGKTTMIIHCESEYGDFDFIFKKKIIKLTKYGENGINVYDKNKVVSKDFNESYTISEHNLYAFILLHDHSGIIEKVKFQDFGNVVYSPEFDYPNCSISDENKDGAPEFYLSYMGESDGLDAKPYKQIIYTLSKSNTPFVKSKATAYYPAGNPEDKYYVDFDKSWQLQNKPIQKKSLEILNKHKVKYQND